jgi:hypothetical protein
MIMTLSKRNFLSGGIALSALASAPALAQRSREPIPHTTATTRNLFKAPPGLPNAVAVVPEGLWIAEQKMSGPLAKQYNMPEPTDLREAAWLVDWNGKVLKTIMTASRNTSGMTVGGGYLWMGAEFPGSADGIYQYDMDGKLLSHRQVPLGPPEDGGGIHGALWHDDKLWVLANRLHAILRLDPVSWMPEFQIPLSNLADRYHAIAWDSAVPGGAVWAVTGNNSKSYKEGQYGLHKYDATTGRLLQTVDFLPGSADPHGLAVRDGKLISCDAGIHPGWPNYDSPSSGYIFEIDIA